ncbi:MAG: Sec-independent protein translocase subunit TatA [Pseudonocardia sp.]
MGEFSVWHWLIVLAVLVLLFGSARLPDAARSLGRSMRILRVELQAAGSTDGSGTGPSSTGTGSTGTGPSSTGTGPSSTGTGPSSTGTDPSSTGTSGARADTPPPA